MEPVEDPKLSELLKEWQVPGAPPSLDRRVGAWREPWWRFLLAGSIRLPVPVGVALAALLLIMAAALLRQPASPRPQPPVNLMDFRPVDNPQVRVIREQL